MEVLAALTSSRSEAERSAVLLGAAGGLLQQVGAPVYNFYVPDPSVRERAVAKARTTLGDAAFEVARERGRAMGFEQAVDYAHSEAGAPGGTEALRLRPRRLHR